MSELPKISQDGKPNPITSQEVEDAYQAFAALRKCAQADPGLTENWYFMALQDTAYARFFLTFEAM